MKKGICILVILLFSSMSWSQSSDFIERALTDINNSDSKAIDSAFDIRKNSVYAELGGKGVVGSINYDRLIPLAKKHGISLGVGISYFDYIFLLVEANYLYGGPKHFLEIGAGFDFSETLVIPRIGYRYQGKKGLFFRVGAMYFQPIQEDSFGDFFWGGVSLGYSF